MTEPIHTEDIAGRPLYGSSQTGPTVVGLLVIALSLWLAAGLIGIAAGVLLVLASLVLSGPVLVGVSFVAAVALTGETTPLELAGLGFGSAIVLLSAVWPTERAAVGRIAGSGLLAGAGFTGTYYLGVSVTGTGVWGGVATGVAFAIVTYGLYRFGVVQQLREDPR